MDIRPDHSGLHAGLLPAAHADHQRPLPAHRPAVAPGEDADQGTQQQEQLRTREPLHIQQAEVEQAERASHQNVV